MNLEKLLSIAFNCTGRTRNISMIENSATNQSKFTQQFKLTAIPSNNKVPKNKKDGGTIVSSAAGYKELVIWINFGDNTDWKGTELKWLYMDRSFKWDQEHLSGGIEDLNKLNELGTMLKKEVERILEVEWNYYKKHGSLDGLVFEEYLNIEWE